MIGVRGGGWGRRDVESEEERREKKIKAMDALKLDENGEREKGMENHNPYDLIMKKMQPECTRF